MPTDFPSLIKIFIDLGLQLIPLLGIVALLVFVFGVGKFIRTSGESKEADKGLLVWGIIALFVLFSVWGIISFLRSEFGFGNELGIPQIRTGNQPTEAFNMDLSFPQE